MGLLSGPATARARTCEVVLWLDDPVAIGALQIDLDYSAASGGFLADSDGLECSGDVPDALALFGHDAEHDVVTTSIVSLVGFVGPRKLVHCTFLDPGNSVVGEDFGVIIRDASDPDSQPLADPHLSVLLPDCGDTTTTTSTTSTTSTSSTSSTSTSTSTTSTTETSTTTSTTMEPCGNGVVDDAEQCDDGNTDDDDGCEGDCTTDVVCGDANGNDAVQTGDALLVLRSAIGQPVHCPLELCDADGDARLRTADALRVLKRAVGQSVVMSCPQDSGAERG